MTPRNIPPQSGADKEYRFQRSQTTRDVTLKKSDGKGVDLQGEMDVRRGHARILTPKITAATLSEKKRRSIEDVPKNWTGPEYSKRHTLHGLSHRSQALEEKQPLSPRGGSPTPSSTQSIADSSPSGSLPSPPSEQKILWSVESADRRWSALIEKHSWIDELRTDELKEVLKKLELSIRQGKRAYEALLQQGRRDDMRCKRLEIESDLRLHEVVVDRLYDMLGSKAGVVHYPAVEQCLPRSSAAAQKRGDPASPLAGAVEPIGPSWAGASPRETRSKKSEVVFASASRGAASARQPPTSPRSLTAVTPVQIEPKGSKGQVPRLKLSQATAVEPPTRNALTARQTAGVGQEDSRITFVESRRKELQQLSDAELTRFFNDCQGRRRAAETDLESARGRVEEAKQALKEQLGEAREHENAVLDWGALAGAAEGEFERRHSEKGNQ